MQRVVTVLLFSLLVFASFNSARAEGGGKGSGGGCGGAFGGKR